MAIYPEEGTLVSDNPFFILDADWVSDDQQAPPRKLFEDFVQQAGQSTASARVRLPAEQP